MPLLVTLLCHPLDWLHSVELAHAGLQEVIACILTLSSLASCWQFEIDHGGSIYTLEISQHHIAGLFLFLFHLERWYTSTSLASSYLWFPKGWKWSHLLLCVPAQEGEEE